MSPAPIISERRFAWWAAGICALSATAVFQFFGNATRGYVDTSSTFWWWISQWMDPRAETGHGWVILAISGWLLWRNLARGAPGAGGRGQGAGRMEQGAGTTEQEGRDGSPSRPFGASAQAEDTGSAATPLAADQAEGESRRGTESAPCRAEHKPIMETRRPRRVQEDRDEGVAAPAIAMLAALALHAVGFIAQQTRISIIALLVFTWGALRLGGGRRWGRAASFPLGFMAFAIPVNVLDSVGFWLRLWVVDAAGWLARGAGIDVVRSGTQLFAADGQYHYDVAAACSGVRSLVALAALSLLIGYLRFQSPVRRVLMLLLCFPLTYLGNVLRIGAIMLAAEMGGQRWGERAHEVMGFGVFAIVLGGVLLAARLVERTWPEVAAPSGPLDEPPDKGGPVGESERVCHVIRDKLPVQPRGSRRGMVQVAVIVGIVTVVAGAEMAWLAMSGAAPGGGAAGVRLAPDGRNPIELPAFIGTEWIGRRAEVSAVERDVLPADTGFSRRNYVSVGDGIHSVFVSIVLSGRDRTSIHRPEICLVGQGWTLSEPAAHEFSVPTGTRFPATLLRTQLTDPRSQRTVKALVAYGFVSADAIVASHRERFFQDAWNRLRHGRADRWAYVLLQADAADGEAAALARMQTVLKGTASVFLRSRAGTGH